jgi:hypothetical protein
VVVRTRNGSILQFVKPFFSKYPTCREFNIDPEFTDNYEAYKISGPKNEPKKARRLKEDL